MFIDTHCHLYAEEFDEDRAEVVARALEAEPTKSSCPTLMLTPLDPCWLSAMSGTNSVTP